MENRPAFFRGIVVGVLAMMVVRSIVWLATPSDHPDATTARYALNVANILICGGTAWSTAMLNERLAAKLDRVVARMRHVPFVRK
jgi:hypothetical protein